MAAELTMEQLKAQLEALKAENEAMKAKQHKAPGVTLKVSPKGCVAAYGIGRFPVVLYSSQWERILAKGEDIKAFIAANADKLKAKE
jgi:hypothetical protein